MRKECVVVLAATLMSFVVVVVNAHNGPLLPSLSDDKSSPRISARQVHELADNTNSPSSTAAAAAATSSSPPPTTTAATLTTTTSVPAATTTSPTPNSTTTGAPVPAPTPVPGNGGDIVYGNITASYDKATFGRVQTDLLKAMGVTLAFLILALLEITLPKTRVQQLSRNELMGLEAHLLGNDGDDILGGSGNVSFAVLPNKTNEQQIHHSKAVTPQASQGGVGNASFVAASQSITSVVAATQQQPRLVLPTTAAAGPSSPVTSNHSASFSSQKPPHQQMTNGSIVGANTSYTAPPSLPVQQAPPYSSHSIGSSNNISSTRSVADIDDPIRFADDDDDDGVELNAML